MPKRKKIYLSIAVALGLAQQTAWAQFPTVLELNDLNGQNGFVINGVEAQDRSGGSVSAAGDFNGDGIDDIIIGAAFANPEGKDNAGISYVIYGSNNPIPSPFNLINIDDQTGLRLNGITAQDNSGVAVSSAGDVNNDGIDDIIIGANRTTVFGDVVAGSSYVVYGDNFIFNPFNLSSINAVNGFTLNGEADTNFSGRSVASAGDFNGDGIDDLIVGAYGASSYGVAAVGKSYVIFGSNDVIPNPFDLGTLNTVYAGRGFSIAGEAIGDGTGFSVSAAGDVNGDGIDDVIIGSESADLSYVLFGSTGTLPGQFFLTDIDGNNGFRITAATSYDQAGISVSAAGDVNGDGIDDIIIGANYADANSNVNAGSSYVIFGSNNGFNSTFNLGSIDGSNGFTINGTSSHEQSGRSVSHLGDVNGDGRDDLIIGATRTNSSAGSSYVIFGSNNGFPHPLNLSSLNGHNGFTINGEASFDLSGGSVSAAGDFNGDGIADILIGAIGADPNSNSYAGSSYVVYGDDGIFTDGFD